MTELNWLVPLLLLPGVATLIISTAARFSELHSEVHGWLTESHAAKPKVIKHLRRRARLYRSALVSLYIAISLFTLGGAISLLAERQGGVVSQTVVVSFTFAGILALIVAAINLVRESFLSLEVIEMHFKDLLEGHLEESQ